MIYCLDNMSRAWTRLKNMSMPRLFLDTLLEHIVNVDTSYPKNPEYPVYPVKKLFGGYDKYRN
jgi:hypothetical protein